MGGARWLSRFTGIKRIGLFSWWWDLGGLVLLSWVHTAWDKIEIVFSSVVLSTVRRDCFPVLKTKNKYPDIFWFLSTWTGVSYVSSVHTSSKVKLVWTFMGGSNVAFVSDGIEWCLSTKSPRKWVRDWNSTTSRPYVSMETRSIRTSPVNSVSVCRPVFHITLLERSV